MKVLQINTVVNSGSTGRIAEEIGELLLQNNHESLIAYGRGKGKSSSKLLKIGNKFDQYKHGLSTLLFDKHGLSSITSTRKAINEIESFKPDIIHLHNIHGYYLNYKELFDYIKSKSKPIVWTFHDAWPITGHCSYFDSVGCEKWKTHCNNCPITNHYPKSLSDRSFKNFEDKLGSYGNYDLHIVTPSKWLKTIVESSFLKNNKIIKIHNGIDIDKFKILNLKRTEQKIILGVASTWDKRKGLKDFIELSKQLNKNYSIVLIGLSKKQIKGLPNNIKGIERTESIDDLVNWYNKASFFINPTYVDNFPTTNIEALACGTPIITYDTGGSAEAIKNESEVGYVVEKGNVSRIAEIIENFSYSEDVGLKCRDSAIKHFNKIERYLDYINLYHSILKKKEI
ncbi:glycosyltransferase [Mesonia sp.]|uniref:glycosyltransferase n=1 Tax=Mesonia sp. TaxID=1960830 RepID=UPI00176974AB|nr:glycosyltransferase [Mesonia sp.]HIB38462.1 glycosyltransferase [Mesonia sp.]